VTPADRLALATLAEYGWPTYRVGLPGAPAVHVALCRSMMYADVLAVFPRESSRPGGHVVAWRACATTLDDPVTAAVRWHTVEADPFAALERLIRLRRGAILREPYLLPADCRVMWPETREPWTPPPEWGTEHDGLLLRRLVPDELWPVIAPFMVAAVTRPQGGGRQRVDDRTAFAAVALALAYQLSWTRIPGYFGVSKATVYRRFKEWSRTGLWPAMLTYSEKSGDMWAGDVARAAIGRLVRDEMRPYTRIELDQQSADPHNDRGGMS
jgi:transposase